MTILFKTQDNDYITNLKTIIIENSINPLSWKTVYNQLYMEDMLTYLRSISSSPVISGIGVLIPKEIIVIEESFKSELYNVKRDIMLVDMTRINDVWITPLKKSNTINITTLIKCLVKEVKFLMPQKVTLNIGNQYKDIVKQMLYKVCEKNIIIN